MKNQDVDAATDALADKVMTAAAISVAHGVPQAIVANAFFRAAVAICISQTGIAAVTETLREAADDLEREARSMPARERECCAGSA